MKKLSSQKNTPFEQLIIIRQNLNMQKNFFNTLTAEGFREVGHFMSLKNHVFMSQ